MPNLDLQRRLWVKFNSEWKERKVAAVLIQETYAMIQELGSLIAKDSSLEKDKVMLLQTYLLDHWLQAPEDQKAEAQQDLEKITMTLPFLVALLSLTADAMKSFMVAQASEE